MQHGYNIGKKKMKKEKNAFTEMWTSVDLTFSNNDTSIAKSNSKGTVSNLKKQNHFLEALNCLKTLMMAWVYLIQLWQKRYIRL